MRKNNDVKKLYTLTKRNTKLYFKDKAAFFSSLITPMILLVLFIAFLKSTYTDSLVKSLPAGLTLDKKVLDGFSGAWLISSVIGVCSVTVAFCVNQIMVNDKVNKSLNDILITPTKRSIVSLSYFFANAVSTLIVNYTCMLAGFVYLLIVGWFFSFADVLMIILIVFICSMFGCALACTVEYFIASAGTLSAVSTLVSCMYGFITGAYMPVSQFSVGIQNFISCLPGTYTIGLLRNYYMSGVLDEMGKTLPSESIEMIKDSFDGNLYFFENKVSLLAMFLVVLISIAVLVSIYLCFVFVKKRKCKKIAKNAE